MTLADLRALLDLAHGPAVERLTDHKAETVARAYQPRNYCAIEPLSGFSGGGYDLHSMIRNEAVGGWHLDLTDPGTVNAIRTALALALGLDPGPMGLACLWEPAAAGNDRQTWHLRTTYDKAHAWFMDADALAHLRLHGLAPYAPDVVILAPEVAAEPDPIKALVLACQHVLKASS